MRFIHQRENKVQVSVALIASLLVLFFLSSKLWLYDDTPIITTPLQTAISELNQTTITINQWEYNKENELMEVTLMLQHTGSDAIKPSFSYSAREANDKSIYNVKVVYQDEQYTVLQIENVPSDYKTLGLFITEKRDIIMLDDEITQKEQVLVADYRIVKNTTAVKNQSPSSYQKKIVGYEMDLIDQQLREIKVRQLPQQEKIIDAYTAEIDQLNQQQKYETEIEQKDTQTIIQAKAGAIVNVEEEVANYQWQAQILQDKKEKLSIKLQDISK